jgi:hypothetical protein
MELRTLVEPWPRRFVESPASSSNLLQDLRGEDIFAGERNLDSVIQAVRCSRTMSDRVKLAREIAARSEPRV